ncbi:MAG: hypothetical protein ACXWLF_08505, partial [Myxococcaceae bacterium]
SHQRGRLVDAVLLRATRFHGPGTMIYYPDPHFEPPLITETGGLMLFVQYQGPTTGGRPIYDGRFNMTERRPITEENVER